MSEYNFDLVVAIIANMVRIRSFVERTTGELFPLYYHIELPKDYKVQEGNTLEDLSPKTTRIPKRDALKENLVILVADVERALSTLDPLERLEVIISLDENYSRRKENEVVIISEHCSNIIEKMVKYLNGVS